MSKLFLVPTPIGNLEDITFRSVRILNEADLILAEDTRTSGKLLKHFDIKTPMQSFHMHNEHKVLDKMIDKLKQGIKIALISDAGTPGISDPGFLLVRACVEEGIETECLPGATALIPALVQSGFPTDRFIFEGFLPPKKGRQTRLKLWSEETRTIVFYESPHKIVKTLSQLQEFVGGDRRLSVSRELSKKFEETVRGTVNELILHFTNKAPKGEFVIVLEGKK
ncbi:MAG: 16S rRNA (cytidine(1402)-2'-O)-methyltransferase [Bacteroidetes bacterium MED-G21]|nr:MAG: 16S rRNA (cytidine(1402)-2'-O)-methyltransferase [Bacteroidetes bacterium MED-G21]|tara:strand:- start:316 stop:987 length:672 start_codon:yes stop_codon:yes gene_type:complete